MNFGTRVGEKQQKNERKPNSYKQRKLYWLLADMFIVKDTPYLYPSASK